MAITSKPIIIPWDYSDICAKALARAAALAESPSQLHVVHVTHYPDARDPSIVWGTYDENEIRARLEESFNNEINRDDYPGVQFHAFFGNPANEITKFAEAKDAGLIVISSHGRTGFNRFVMGSVAERVVRLAHCPVLVLRNHEE